MRSQVSCALLVPLLLGLFLAPAAAQNLPALAPGYQAEVYAGLEFRPGEIDFDNQHRLYIANLDAGENPIYRVDATGNSVPQIGPDIPDPDALMVDREGWLGDAGSALVGSSLGGCSTGCRGRITEVRANGSTRVAKEGGCLGNISQFERDSQGRIYVVNTNSRRVCVIQNGSVSTFISSVAGTGYLGNAIAVDHLDRFYVGVAGVIRQYDSSGALLDASWDSGYPRGYVHSGPFRGLVLIRDGDLVIQDVETMTAWTLVYGVLATDVKADEYGDLFLSDATNDRILRITPVPDPVPLPTVATGYDIEEWTRVPFQMAELAIDENDDLFVGNLSAGLQSIFKVPVADQTAFAFCEPIKDPDAVIVDRAGIVAGPGYILAGGSVGGCSGGSCTGRIASISPDGLVITVELQGGDLGNVQGFASWDPNIIYANNTNRGTVSRITATGSSQFIGPVGATTKNISENSTVDDQGNLYLAWDDVTRKYSSTGALLDAAFVAGNAKAFAPSGPFAGLVVQRARQVYLVDPDTKDEFLLIDDVGANSVVFDSQGSLFLTNREYRRILRVWGAFGTIAGTVSADCPSPATPLLGVTVDAFDALSGDLVATMTTGADGAYLFEELPAGDYSLSVVTPLGYAPFNELNVTLIGGDDLVADIGLSCVVANGDPRSKGFWKHQVGVALSGKGNAQVDEATLCEHLDTIAAHFYSNELNPVEVYVPPASGLCEDKLEVAKDLLNLKGKQEMVTRARQHLMALLLNVADGRLHLADTVSEDGATLSQAITWCDLEIDDPAGDHERAKDVAEILNGGGVVPAGWIDLETSDIAYRKPGAPSRVLTLLPNRPNPFNPATEIRFHLPQQGEYALAIHDVTGRLVWRATGRATAGDVQVRWKGVDSAGQSVAAGIYSYTVRWESQRVSGKMTLVK